MSHARQQIREAVATLVTGLTTTGSSVFQSRFYRVQASELPALFIYSTDESIERETIGTGPYLRRELSIRIEGMAKALDNLDDTLDIIGEEVEDALGGQLPAGVDDFRISSVSIDYSGEGEQPVGVIRMDFVARYQTAEDDSGSII